MKILSITCLSKNFPCKSNQIAFDYDSYFNNIDDGCQLKYDSFQIACVFAQPNCLQKCGIMDKTFLN